jgi:hypothetical protein
MMADDVREAMELPEKEQIEYIFEKTKPVLEVIFLPGNTNEVLLHHYVYGEEFCYSSNDKSLEITFRMDELPKIKICMYKKEYPDIIEKLDKCLLEKVEKILAKLN